MLFFNIFFKYENALAVEKEAKEKEAETAKQ